MREAHRASNGDLLTRGYTFADWCARHHSKEIWNAAGAAFYEHLLDGRARPEEIAPWLTSETYAELKGCLLHGSAARPR